MSTVLVTGAGGFIGRCLTPELLEAGHEVIAVMRPGGRPPSHDGGSGSVQVVECDLADADAARTLVLDERPGAIVNLAVERTGDLPEDRPVNTTTVEALLGSSARVGAHFVHLGSSMEYGSHRVPMGPDTTCRPETTHGITKLEATRIVCDAVADGLVRGCVLRPFYVYGNGEPASRLISSAVRAAMTGSKLPLTEPGIGHDLVLVADVTAAIRSALRLELSSSRPIDLCTGRTTLNETVVDLIEAETGRRIDREVGGFRRRAWDREVWTGDPRAFEELIGRPPRSLEDGIRLLLQAPGGETR